MGLVESQERIDVRLRHGGSLSDVEHEIIDPSPLTTEQKAALWLYASATMPKDGHRSTAGHPSGVRIEEQ